MNENVSTLHEKAKILADGGIVEISGMRVILRHEPKLLDPCAVCDIGFLCCKGTDIFELCVECDSITGEDCFLIPVE